MGRGHEVVGAALWDRQTFVSNVTRRLSFFTVGRALLRDGNLQSDGGLPPGQEFLVRTIRVVPMLRPDQRRHFSFEPEGLVNYRLDDLARIYNDGVVSFNVLAKNYGQYPLFMLLPGTGVVVNQAGITTTVTANRSSMLNFGTVGVPDNRAAFELARPFVIPGDVEFKAELEWPAPFSLVAGNLGLEMVLTGRKLRPAIA